ncbi:hypothetical protein ACFW9L_06405 [Streptomyces sp. NPDC059517]|uniref:hypothetical protein n=1 Tax=Streptomyces sp. NPDC059517 TaxID=3346855 RepID=UPI00369CD4D5
MESAEPSGRPGPEPADTGAPEGCGAAEVPERVEGLVDFVPDPAARAELARRMSELADLIDEAGDTLGEILQDVQRLRRD